MPNSKHHPCTLAVWPSACDQVLRPTKNVTSRGPIPLISYLRICIHANDTRIRRFVTICSVSAPTAVSFIHSDHFYGTSSSPLLLRRNPRFRHTTDTHPDTP